MMKLTYIIAAMMVSLTASTSVGSSGTGDDDSRIAGFRETMRLYDNGMYSRSRFLFDSQTREWEKSEPEGYSVLCDVLNNVPGYRRRMQAYAEKHPYSRLLPQLRYYHAMNLFDSGNYREAAAELSSISRKHVSKSHLTEYLFKKAYCDLENRNLSSALENFKEVVKRPFSDYTAPSSYAIGYIEYQQKNFGEAIKWFEKSSSDPRFTEISNYYVMECRFMLEDYKYVTEHGEQMYDAVPKDRKPHLARIISESYLVLGDAENARRYYELNILQGGDEEKTRSDWFFSGSVLYAVEDYKGAIDNFLKMGERTDSIGQVASYHLAYSYIQTKDKVSAMGAFKDASQLSYDADIAEDAYFNYAKLAFDLNNDTSAFNDYLKKYSDLEKGDRINSYIAVAALYAHDYEGAVNAYDRIDELDDDMTLNYVKANYLRANQLIRNGSYRKAIPCLKAAAYYSERNTKFNQLARYWLAESYYRNDDYKSACETFTELYNTSALYGMPESHLIIYNIAYCYFKSGNYEAARKWFTEYLAEKSVKYRKEALERKADCHFMAKDYKTAASAYDLVLKDYFNADDIYPYYQGGIAYGLANAPLKKIELLSNVLKASPDAEFYPEALFELGRSYAVREDDDNAFDCFNRLAREVKDSTFVAKAYIEMGSLARNQSQYNDALSYYKTVVEQMPLSEYADDALLAIESIYQTRNEPEEYIAYIENIGKGAIKTEDEKENMIFNSAEQIFLSENYQKALVSLQAYLEKYPSGANVYKANFYIAESYRQLGKSEQACDYYCKVIDFGEGSLVELSMLHFSDLSFRLEHWSDAYGGYTALYEAAKLPNNKYAAMVGMMRSAYKGHDWDNALKEAGKVVADSRSDAAVRTEAEYIKAKSYMASSRREQAFPILQALAEDVSGAYGAEAAYLLIQDSYDRGDFEKVETQVYAFSDAGSGQMYWLAKSFIVLGDSFAERGEIEQAKATFESVRDGYTPSGTEDEVLDNVMMRLRKLEELSITGKSDE